MHFKDIGNPAFETITTFALVAQQAHVEIYNWTESSILGSESNPDPNTQLLNNDPAPAMKKNMSSNSGPTPKK